METTVEITNNNKSGLVSYDTELKTITVEFPDEEVRKGVENYLALEKEFKVPESQQIDDYRVDKAFAKDSLMYFELSMCTLDANTGVFVNWETQNES